MLVFMKQHGRTILLAIIAVSVLGVIFRIRVNGYTGFIHAAYGKAMEDVDLNGARTLHDIDAVKAAAVRSSPQISFCCEEILPQKEINLKDMLTAEDADGNRVDAEITDIVNEAGESILYQTEEDRRNKVTACDPTSFLFPSVGIYVMNVKAVDREQKAAEVQFRIPVTGSGKHW